MYRNRTTQELLNRVIQNLGIEDKEQMLNVIKLSVPIIEKNKIDNFLPKNVELIIEEIHPKLKVVA